MKSKNAYIVDAYSHDSYHEVINQGLLMMVAGLYDNVTYIAESSACKNLKRLMDAVESDYSNVKFIEKKRRRDIRTGHPTIDRFIDLLIISCLNYYYYMKTPKGNDVFYNNNLYFASFFISFFSFGKKNSIFDVCHNEMEDIDKHHVDNNISRFMYAYLNAFFCKMRISKRFKFILLSEDMAEYFKSFIPPKNHHVIEWMDHPYIRSSFVNSEEFDFKKRTNLSFGIPGLVSPSRGLQEMKELLSTLSNPNLTIYGISVVTEPLKSPYFVKLNQSKNLLPFQEYTYYIKQMDALILLYKHGTYRLTASGAILEAIWNGKPIFAIENAYFRYLFNKFGDIGKLFESAVELANYINALEVSELSRFSDNLQHAKHELHPLQVAEQLKRIVCVN